MRTVKVLALSYLGLSIATLVAIYLLRDHASLVNDAAWVRCTIVVLSALGTTLFAFQAARGSRKGYLRLRILSAVMVVAITVIVAIPGFLPAWIRIEQAACGVLLLAVVVIAFSPRVREAMSS
ncbi:hypothetical protein [Hamadaea tsunoensis]|uniref:hypothetical protein n=1 Tax=Hamadaea tsunoensis TaxID=53368 RepID=UPI000415E077|nr:hypothetical protein [Hamadaea tsunoensis]